MNAAFQSESIDKLRAPFKATEWKTIELSAHSARASGVLSTPIRDPFDLLSVSHFFNIFDRYWPVLVGETITPTEKKLKQTVLGWMREIKNLRDPLSHPAEAAFTREDAFRFLDCGQRVLSRLGRSDEATELMGLMDQIFAPRHADEARAALDHRLPSSESVVVGFIGRELELSELRAWFNEPTSALWALAGEGGKGKSAIAYTFACEIQEQAPPPFQIVLWLSAKKRRFIEGTTAELDEPDFQDLETALSQILTQLGWTEDVGLPVESRKARVIELLNEFPALVVVDDVDSLDAENEDAISFFALQVPRTRSKILFTSRRTIFGMGKSTTHVSGFSQEDAEAFIRNRADLIGLDKSQLTDRVVREIFRLTDGSPLYMEDLLRLAVSAKSPGGALRMWQGRSGAAARRYALERECELLTQSARDVLLAGCVAKGSVSFSELSSIIGIDDETVSTALQALRNLFLFPKPKFVEGEQRFSLNVNTRTLVLEVYGQTEQWRRIQAAYQAITKGLPANDRSRVGAIIRQCGLLVNSGRLEEAEKLMDNALLDRPGDSDLYGFSGWIYKSWQPPRIADARRQFNRASELKSIKGDVYEHWARMEIKQREWTSAAAAAEKGLELIPDSAVLSYLAGTSRSRLSRELIGGLHHERAAKEAKDACTHLERALAKVLVEDRVSKEDIFRGLVLHHETMREPRGIARYLKLWNRENPSDHRLDFETQRLQHKFQTAFE